jgi:hypothetical protein
MQVLKPTMSVILNNIVLIATWMFHWICEYAWPMVRWITSSNMLIVTKNEELEDVNELNDEKGENDEQEQHYGNETGNEKNKVVVNSEIYKCEFLTAPSNDDEFIKEKELLAAPCLHESKSMPDLLIMHPIISKNDLKVRPSSLDLQELGKSQNYISVKEKDKHKFISRLTLSSDICIICSKKIKFGETYKKCKNCRI